MKRSCLTILILSVTFTGTSMAQNHLADGTRMIRGNRLTSARTPSGRQLHGSDRQFRKIQIELDGAMNEPVWESAATAVHFLDTEGVRTGTTVRVLFDEENVYLYWTVSEPDGITSKLQEKDGIITTDDYVQVKLKPWLPKEITVARGYYYTIAANPDGHFWDAYFDPYLGGYFFSSWDSGVQIATEISESTWTSEMVIPFSGLDHYSDKGWDWGLAFNHSSIGEDGNRKSSSPTADIVVRQGIQVRRQNLVDYYWTRPEFLEEVKPGERDSQAFRVQSIELDGFPETNQRLDEHLWMNIPEVEIAVSDRTGISLGKNTARAKIAYRDSDLILALEADGAQPQPASRGKVELGNGMAAQTASVNGVFVDGALFTDECFWILLQPRDPALDHVHQSYYLILVNNRGEVRGTHYDRFGTPDRSWNPNAIVDLYDTSGGWGVEVRIALNSFVLPIDSAPVWGFNLFRNRLASDDTGSRSELQAWAYTGADFLNPDTFGSLEGIPRPGLDVLKAGLEHRIDNLKNEFTIRLREQPELRAQMTTRLETINLNSQEDLRDASSTLEQLDRQLGSIEALNNFRSVAHPAQGGHAILDLQFIGRNGWAVGAMGTVLITRDSGQSWKPVELESDADLYRVVFVNKSEGWAAGGRIRMGATNESMRHDERGGFGYIFHTKDGGETWECQYGERGRHIFGLHFVDDRTGYACGELGFLLKTTDGGTTWRELSTTGTWRWLYSITFLDENHGFAVGESETLIKTVNGGKSWKAVAAPSDRQFYGFRPSYRDIRFQGPTGCIVGQNGTVLISSDQGGTWKSTASFIDPQIREFLDFSRVVFSTPKTGFAVSELGTRILVTEDGGQSWTLRPVANQDWLRAVWADPGGRVFLAGEREKILESHDQGYNWKTLHGDRPKADVLVMLAHGDDAAIELGGFNAHYALDKGKQIVDVEVLRDAHSVEYRGEIYNLEHHRTMRMSGVRTTTYFDEFENGNNGSDYYHFTERLWEGQENVVRHMVAVIRAYRPDVVIIHDGVFGDYDKPGHKLSGRAGIPAFETAGGEKDLWPELTRLGLEPWQAKKLYALAGESYPPTIDLEPIGAKPLPGTDGTCLDWAEYALRNFQSQGVYHADNGKLSLIKSVVPVPAEESSIFDGLE